MVLDKVLTDERSAAYVTTISDINRWWLECKECNWYKSKENILSEARLLMLRIIGCYLFSSQDPYAGWLSIKKYSFNEKLAIHMLHYQQVRFTELHTATHSFKVIKYFEYFLKKK